jgi:hypothetical protein
MFPKPRAPEEDEMETRDPLPQSVSPLSDEPKPPKGKDFEDIRPQTQVAPDTPVPRNR